VLWIDKALLTMILSHYPTTVTPSGCIEFNGPRLRGRYGYIRVKGIPGRKVLTHRIAAFLCGKLQSLDDPALACHKCNNPPCINGDHIYRGDARTNMLDRKASGFVTANAKKTHCKKGHPLSGPNLVFSRDGARHCRICRKAYTQKGLSCSG
jgi:hypothetical protein